MLVACVFPEQQDQPYSVLPRRLYIIGWEPQYKSKRVWYPLRYRTQGVDATCNTVGQGGDNAYVKPKQAWD
jgi:hypothetical protein